MTKHHPIPTAAQTGDDYLPAAGRHALLPFYDLLTAVTGIAKPHRALIAQADLADGQRVLEIGCGTGNLTLRVKRARPGVDLVGSDPDPRALARAQRKANGYNGIRFERGYAQALPHPDASFDRVLSAFMLHHLDLDTKAAAAAEARRVLRPGGSLHLVDFAPGGHGPHGFPAQHMLRAGHVVDNVDDGIPRLLGAAGLDCAEVSAHRHAIWGRIVFYRATPAAA